MDNPLYDHSSIMRRPKLELPDGARLAVWFGLNIEHYQFGQPALSIAPFTSELVPDPLNYGWRDYGARVGVERVMRIFDRHGVRATAITNSEVCQRYPEIIEEAVAREWGWVAHGKDNSSWWVGMSPEEETAAVGEITKTLEAATGVRPRGWLGPSLTATMNTNDALAANGFTHNLDWPNDDQPYDLKVKSGRLISLPYSLEVNDIPIFVLHHQTGEDFQRTVTDQFDMLYEEGTGTARVMGVGLHPFLIGQPFRAKYLDRALEHITSKPDVWLATSDEIADWYLGAA